MSDTHDVQASLADERRVVRDAGDVAEAIASDLTGQFYDLSRNAIVIRVNGVEIGWVDYALPVAAVREEIRAIWKEWLTGAR